MSSEQLIKFRARQAKWMRDRRRNMSESQKILYLKKAAKFMRDARAKMSPEEAAKYLAERKKQRDELKSLPKGRCKFTIGCPNPGLGKSSYCLHHWLFKMIWCGLVHRCDSVGATLEELESKWNEQKGMCAISGIEISAGETASLDHIIPISRGGGSCIGNLRFVHKRFNGLKGTMTDIELKDMLKKALPALITFSNG